MVRKIIKIEEAACNGCGICAAACHEGAIEMREGKARLVREDFCDGLGDCLPGCPTGAISFEVREAPEYNAAAVAQAKAPTVPAPLPCGCPGSQPRTIGGKEGMSSAFPAQGESCLGQWPVQIKLVPGSGAVFLRRPSSHSRRLYGLCLWKFPPGVYEKSYYPDWLSEVG